MDGAHLLCESLRELRVPFFAGIPGTDTTDVYDIAESYGIRPIVVRNEQFAPMFADGYARVSRKYGAVVSIPGPGAAALIPGLHEAYYSSVPLLVIATDIPREFLGQDRGHLHEFMHMEQLFDSVTQKQFLIRNADEIPRAFRAVTLTRSTRRSPHLFHIPTDVYKEDGGEYPAPIARTVLKPQIAGNTRNIVDALKRAQRPVIFAGAGVWLADAMEPLRELAEKLRAPVFTSVKGKGVISDDHRSGFGQLSGEPELAALITESDCILGIGTRWSQRYTDKWTLPIPQNLYEINATADDFGRSYPSIAAITGDIAQIIITIARDLPQKMDLAWGNLLDAAYSTAMQRVSCNYPTEIRLVDTIRAAIPKDAIIVNDSTIFTYWTRRYFPMYRPGSFLWPMGSGTIGWGLPAALGARLATQLDGTNRPVVLFVGDGGLQFSMQELGTMMQENLPIIIVLFDDSKYGVIEHFQKQRYGKHTTATTLKNPYFSELMAAYRIEYRYAPTVEKCGEAVAQAVRSQHATVIHCPIALNPPTRL